MTSKAKSISMISIENEARAIIPPKVDINIIKKISIFFVNFLAIKAPMTMPTNAPIIEIKYIKFVKYDVKLFILTVVKKIENIIKNKIIADNEAYIACLFDVTFHPTKLITPMGKMRYKK